MSAGATPRRFRVFHCLDAREVVLDRCSPKSIGLLRKYPTSSKGFINHD